MDTTTIICLIAFGIVIPIIALSKASYVERRIMELEKEIRQLHREVSRLAQPCKPASTVEPPPQEKSVSQPAYTTPTYTAPPSVPRQEPTPVSIPPSQANPGQESVSDRVSHIYNRHEEPATPRPGSRTREEWEMLIGGNLLLKIGAVALLIGVAYLMQVLSRGEVIPPVLRVVFGFAAGGAFVVLGNHFHKRGAHIFAQGLMGAGIGILYISAYVSFKSYQLIPQTAAIFLMSAVTAVAILESLKYDSLMVSLLGLFGGFLTPALIGGEGGAGGGSWLGLFIYLTLLNAGLLAVAIKKDEWFSIEPLALLGTWGTFFVWHERYYTDNLLGLSVTFAVIFWALFYAVDAYRTARSVNSYSSLRSVVAVLNSGALYGALYIDINRHHPELMGLVVLVMSAVYLGTVLSLLRARQGDTAFVARNLVTSIAFLAAATYIQFSDQPMLMVTLWSLEALGLVWAGIRWQLRSVCISALGLFVFSVVMLLSHSLAHSSNQTAFIPVANLRFLAYAVLAGCMGLSTLLFARSDVEEREQVISMLDMGWAVLLFILFTAETGDYFRRWAALKPQAALGVNLSMLRYLVLGLVWMLYSLPLTWSGLRNWRKPLTYTGLISLGLGLIAVATYSAQFAPIANFTPVLNIRTAILAAAAVILLIQLKIITKPIRNEDWIPAISDILRLVTVAVGFELVTVEVLDWFRAHQQWDYAVNKELARRMALAGVWAIYSVPVMWTGVRRKLSALVVAGSGILILAAVFTATQGGHYSPAAGFTLLTNIRAAAFLIVVAAMITHRRLFSSAVEDYPSLAGMPTAYRVITSLLLFELVSVETWDYFGMAQVTGHSVDLRQTALSLAWLGYSVLLMCYGIWSRTRVLRFVSLGIYLAAITKVFLYDLRSLEILYRTFSFIGLGLILIATSYLYQRFRSVIAGEETEA